MAKSINVDGKLWSEGDIIYIENMNDDGIINSEYNTLVYNDIYGWCLDDDICLVEFDEIYGNVDVFEKINV